MGFTKDSPGGSVLVGMVSGSITVTNQHGQYHQGGGRSSRIKEKRKRKIKRKEKKKRKRKRKSKGKEIEGKGRGKEKKGKGNNRGVGRGKRGERGVKGKGCEGSDTTRWIKRTRGVKKRKR